MNDDIYSNAQKLNNAVSNFIELVRSFNKRQLQKFSCGSWTTKDVLCHIVFWHEHYLSILQSIYNKNEPVFLKGTIKENSYKGIKMNKDASINKLTGRLADAQEIINHIILSNKIAPYQMIRFNEKCKLRTLDSAILKTEAHIREHTEHLKNYFHIK